jgi:folate-binding protein YgfZ
MPHRTSFHDAASKSGAQFREEADWLIPSSFSASQREYKNARETAALFDVSHHAKIELAGPDAASFLHNLCTNEILKLPAGQGCEAYLTTNQAKIVAVVLVFPYSSPDGGQVLALDAGPGMNERVTKHLDRYLITEQVEITDKTFDFGQLHVTGPRAGDVVEKTLGVPVSGLRELQHTKSDAFGTSNVRVHRRLGLPGFDVVVPRDHASSLWDALIQAGAAPAGIDTYHTLRVEAGTPQYGIDITEANLPYEVGRVEQTISFTKGCYLGQETIQETIARIRTYGHANRTLVGLKLGDEPFGPGTKLLRDEKEVGEITSCVYSPKLDTMIAMGYVRRGNEEPGTTLLIGESGTRAAAVVKLPFIESS